MKLYKTKNVFVIFIISLLILGCDEIYQEQLNKENLFTPGISQININGKVFIPFPVMGNLMNGKKGNYTALYEYSVSKNELNITDKTLPKNFIGHTIWNELLYIATAQSIATYTLSESGLEKLSYLPTPNGDAIVAILMRKNLLNAITKTDNNLNSWLWDNKEWKLENTIAIDAKMTPSSALSTYTSSTNCFLFWVNNRTTFFLDLDGASLKAKETSINDLSHLTIWSEKDEIILSGFNKDFELIHYRIEGLNRLETTATKISIGNYPPFSSRQKLISLLPIKIDQDLKGFVYGTIDDNPIWISKEKMEFPQNIVKQSELKKNQLFYSQIGMLVGAIFLFSTMSWKISTAWEFRFSNLNLPQNSIYFGPTIHRGMAFLIDILVIILISHIIIHYIPDDSIIFTEITKIFTSILHFFSLDVETIFPKGQIPFFIIAYLINLIYGALSEYHFGQTLGKFSLGLKVYSEKDLKKLHILQALSRNLIPKFPSSMPIILFSNISISITNKKKSLNDYAGNSVVLYKRLNDKLKINILNISI